MRVLLDTHVLLWWDAGSRRLGAAARKKIARAEVVYISAASAWEIAIKVALGRLRLKDTVATLVERNRFEELPISVAHAEQVGQLPPHHTDPFDRLLVAQAQLEGLTMVTHDPHMEPYRVPIIWA